MVTETKTGTDNITIYISQAVWKGKIVTVQSVLPCSFDGHRLEVMHHTDEGGKHYCPTMFLYCPYCSGVADEPEPYECDKWGKK